MGACEIRQYLSDTGIDDYAWAQCERPATRDLAYVPPWMRAEVLAARTTTGYVRGLGICDECAGHLARMIQEDTDTGGDLGRWVAVDGQPDPFGTGA